MSLSELERSKDFSRSRLYYYLDIKFKVNNRVIKVILKLDTGSPYTVISLNNIKANNVEVYKYIKKNVNISKYIRDASGNNIDLRKIDVFDFKFTEDIIFDKISIYFSESLRTRSVLGMDIISLFMHTYRLDTHSTSGTYWIHNYEDSFKRFSNLKDENGYYNPSGILSLTDKDAMSLDELRSYCMFLEDELEIQKNINSGLYIVNNKLKELENKDS